MPPKKQKTQNNKPFKRPELEKNVLTPKMKDDLREYLSQFMADLWFGELNKALEWLCLLIACYDLDGELYFLRAYVLWRQGLLAPALKQVNIAIVKGTDDETFLFEKRGLNYKEQQMAKYIRFRDGLVIQMQQAKQQPQFTQLSHYQQNPPV